jgi:4-carboxymuconolactone decarboxylase
VERAAKGKAIMAKMFGDQPEDQRPAFKEMGEITADHLFGEIWAREGLALRDRSLVTISILVATGKERQLRVHLKGALANGLTPNELKEAMIHAAHYSGWPSGMNGLRVLHELMEERGLSFGAGS